MIVVSIIIVLWVNVVLKLFCSKGLVSRSSCYIYICTYTLRLQKEVQWIDEHVNSLKLLCFPFQHIFLYLTLI